MSTALAETGAPFTIGGVAPMPAFLSTGEFRGRRLSEPETQRAWLYLLGEMARRGVLWRRQSLLVLSYSHSDEDIAEVVAACRESLSGLAERLAARTLDNDISFAPPPGFSRL